MESIMKRWIFLILALSLPQIGFAETPAVHKAAPAPSLEGEAVDVSKVTEKYWAQGKDSELGVVQNRKYSNERRFEIDLLTGSLSYDPFQSIANYGGSIGYYFSQYFSVHGIAWRNNVSDSAAYKSLKTEAPTADLFRNTPKSFYGIQFNENFLYGKASLLGKMIIYVDLFLLGGAGVLNSANGNNFAPFFGIGQKIHINRNIVLHLDYRVIGFKETVKNTAGSTQTRSNTSDAITFGLGYKL
jgi:outer membrane beta-barrel protein